VPRLLLVLSALGFAALGPPRSGWTPVASSAPLTAPAHPA